MDTRKLEAAGVEIKWIEDDGRRILDLKRANLSWAELSWAELSGANLSEADLRRADLRRADLRWADLSGADLRWADLSGANLSGADLSEANLSWADLSKTKGLLNPIQYLDDNFDYNEHGLIVYKSFGETYPPNNCWTIEPGAIIEEAVNPLPTLLCACGINVAKLEWCKHHCREPIWKCLIRWKWLPSIVVPYNTDGKIRVGCIELIEII